VKGYEHLIVISFGILGLLLTGILIDLDHKGSFKCKWKTFWGKQTEEKIGARGIFHRPVVAFSIISFSACISIGMLIHILMDFLKI